MSELELLRYYLAQERSTVKRLSKDEHGLIPIAIFEDAYKEAKERAELLDLMIKMKEK